MHFVCSGIIDCQRQDEFCPSGFSQLREGSCCDRLSCGFILLLFFFICFCFSSSQANLKCDQQVALLNVFVFFVFFILLRSTEIIFSLENLGKYSYKQTSLLKLNDSIYNRNSAHGRLLNNWYFFSDQCINRNFCQSSDDQIQ